MNALPDGFYIDGERFGRAAMKAGVLYAMRRSEFNHNAWHKTIVRGDTVISDSYGRNVCASRQ